MVSLGMYTVPIKRCHKPWQPRSVWAKPDFDRGTTMSHSDQLLDRITDLACSFQLNPGPALAYARQLPDLGSFVPPHCLPHVGWYAVPNESAMARVLFPWVTNPADQHCTALAHAQARLGDDFNSCYTPNGVSPSCLNRHPRTAEMLSRIIGQQGGSDIIVVAAQLGPGHQGESTANVQYTANECGMDAVSVGSILACRSNQLQPCFGMDCGGDIFRPYGTPGIPFYRYRGGRIEFGTSPNNCRDPESGVATIFVR
jgi:hypothetical protein